MAAQRRGMLYGTTVKLPRDTFFAIEVADQIDNLSVFQLADDRMSSGFKKHHAPAVVNPAIAIVETVDRSVELIVTAHRHHQKLIRLQIDFRQADER